jgi:hypothetical protein
MLDWLCLAGSFRPFGFISALLRQSFIRFIIAVASHLNPFLSNFMIVASFVHICSVHPVSLLLLYVAFCHEFLCMSHVLPPVALIIVYSQIKPRFHDTIVVQSGSLFYVDSTNSVIMSKT